MRRRALSLYERRVCRAFQMSSLDRVFFFLLLLLRVAIREHVKGRNESSSVVGVSWRSFSPLYTHTHTSFFVLGIYTEWLAGALHLRFTARSRLIESS